MLKQYPFQTAIIDPPWPYDTASANEKLSGYVSQVGNKQYDTMTIKDLAALPIGDVVQSYIFLWTVSPFLQDALNLLRLWGFEYKSQLCWHKNTGYGVGYWFRGDHELVLFAKRKGTKAIRTNERSLFATPRTRHSAKPDNVHLIAEEHFPGPYLEVFARRERPGWTVLGNEAPGDGLDIRESLQKYIRDEGLLQPDELAPSGECVSAAA